MTEQHSEDQSGEEPGSITRWLEEIKQGVQGEPQRRIVDHFLYQLEALARRRLKHLHGYENEEDVALSAMNSFLMRVPANEYAGLCDRKSLWRLLAAITLNKAVTAQRKQMAQKRDVRRETSLEAMLQEEPSHALLDSVVSEGNRLLESLNDQTLRTIAQMRMEGFTNEEVAASIQRSVKTVERKLLLIRKKLQAELHKSDE